MTVHEMITLLQAHEDEAIDIENRAKTLRLDAEALYIKIRDIVHNTHFASADDYELAHREVEKFNRRLFRRLGIDHDAF